MASTLSSGLGLDNADLNNKLVLISEENQSDSSFMTTCLIWKGLLKSDEKSPTNACLLSFHNTQEHYENVGIKLGFNIGNYMKKGNVVFVDGLKLVNDFLNNTDSKELTDVMLNDFCKNLFFMVKDKVNSLSQNHSNNVYLLIDHISDLLLAGFSLQSVWTLIKYFRTLLYDKGLTLTIGTYLTGNDAELCVVYKKLFSVADYCISVSGLKTGFSADVTGCINIVEKTVNEFGYNDFYKGCYHFKFNDRQVKIFYPGTIQ